MINREDMLELTRRMTPARSHIDRIAGAYYDAEGYIDGTFNTHFLKLFTAEKTKNLELAKAVLQAETNKQLKDYRIPGNREKAGKYLAASGWNQRVRAAERCVFGSAL